MLINSGVYRLLPLRGQNTPHQLWISVQRPKNVAIRKVVTIGEFGPVRVIVFSEQLIEHSQLTGLPQSLNYCTIIKCKQRTSVRN